MGPRIKVNHQAHWMIAIPPPHYFLNRLTKILIKSGLNRRMIMQSASKTLINHNISQAKSLIFN